MQPVLSKCQRPLLGLEGNVYVVNNLPAAEFRFADVRHARGLQVWTRLLPLILCSSLPASDMIDYSRSRLPYTTVCVGSEASGHETLASATADGSERRRIGGAVHTPCGIICPIGNTPSTPQ